MRYMRYKIFAISIVLTLLIIPVQSVKGGAVIWGDKDQTATGCGLVLSPTNTDTKSGAVGCACNYDVTTVVTGTPPKQYKYHITCESDAAQASAGSSLVCSTNLFNPSSSQVCLVKVGQPCPAQNFVLSAEASASCEAGTICKNGLCELDTGGEKLEGILGSEVSDIRDTIRLIINVALGFLGVLTVIFIIYGGVLWLTAAGDDEKVKKGKHTLIWAAIGAIVISIAWTIASYVLQVGKTIG